MNKFRLLGMALIVALASYAGTASAEVRVFIMITERGFGPHREIALKLPHGWVILGAAKAIKMTIT